MSIRIFSPAFGEGQPIPPRYTADGQNLSPPLRWENLPEGTRELALICDDPDAPMAEPFVHWVAFKIPPEVGQLPEGIPQKPATRTPVALAQGPNSARHLGYDGPAPPRGHGVHHYHFHLYALDRPLQLEPRQDHKALLASMAGHILDEGEIVGTYERMA